MGVGQVTGLAEQLAEDIGAIDHYLHSRWRVYPQDVTSTVLVRADAAANTFGSWAKVVPLNTIPFTFHIIGIVIESVSAATTYFFQVGCNPEDAVPGTNMECGERRVRLVTVPIARATEILEIHGQESAANSTVWARLKTASGAADTANISLVLSRHVEVSKPATLWPTFPW